MMLCARIHVNDARKEDNVEDIFDILMHNMTGTVIAANKICNIVQILSSLIMYS